MRDWARQGWVVVAFATLLLAIAALSYYCTPLSLTLLWMAFIFEVADRGGR